MRNIVIFLMDTGPDGKGETFTTNISFSSRMEGDDATIESSRDKGLDTIKRMHQKWMAFNEFK